MHSPAAHEAIIAWEYPSLTKAASCQASSGARGLFSNRPPHTSKNGPGEVHNCMRPKSNLTPQIPMKGCMPGNSATAAPPKVPGWQITMSTGPHPLSCRAVNTSTMERRQHNPARNSGVSKQSSVPALLKNAVRVVVRRARTRMAPQANTVSHEVPKDSMPKRLLLVVNPCSSSVCFSEAFFQVELSPNAITSLCTYCALQHHQVAS